MPTIFYDLMIRNVASALPNNVTMNLFVDIASTCNLCCYCKTDVRVILLCYVYPRLKPLDIAFMRAIHHKVNIVPIIAKSDTITKDELIHLKHAVSSSGKTAAYE